MSKEIAYCEREKIRVRVLLASETPSIRNFVEGSSRTVLVLGIGERVDVLE